MPVHKGYGQLSRRAVLLGGLAAWRVSAADKATYSDVQKGLRGHQFLIIPYSHMDWAWVHSVQWQGDRSALVLEEVLDILAATPDYRFFVDTWNECVERFVKRSPHRIPAFRRAVAHGQIAVCGGTVCNQHPGWMETESLVRNMILGRKLFRTLIPDFQTSVMVHNDVTPGPAQMPQILRLAGYGAYRFFRPDASLSAEAVPRDFIWEGSDGSTILVSRGTYGGLWGNESTAGFKENWKDAVERFYLSELKPASEPQSARVVWVPMGADDSRPLRTGILREGRAEELIPLVAFVREWEQRERVSLKFATPEEYFRELEKESDSLPRHKGVLDPTMWTFWYGINGNDSLRLWRARADQMLVEAEAAASCASTLGDTYPYEEIENAWLEVLRASSHAQNWLFAADYTKQLNRVKQAGAEAERLRDRALASIAGRVRVQERPEAVLLWNPLPWDRTEVVEVWATFQDPQTTNFRVRDTSGAEVPFQVIDLNDSGRTPTSSIPRRFKEGRVLVKARVPALGYTTLYFEPAPGAVDVPESRPSGELDAGFAQVEFSRRGIESVVDSATRLRYREAGNVIYNEINDTGPYHYGPVTQTLKWEQAEVVFVSSGPLCSRFGLRGTLGSHRVELEARLFPHAGRIAFKTEIDSSGGSGHFMAAVGLPGEGEFHVDTHFGVEGRDPSQTEYEAPERLRKNVFYGAHWADWSGTRGGMTLLATTGEKGYQYFPDQPALGHFLLMTMPPATDNWERFVTPAREGRGRHSFDYQLLLHGQDWKAAQIPKRALEARYPIRALRQNHRLTGASLAEERAFLRITPGSVQMSAFCREDADYCLRLFESTGEPADAKVELPFSPAFAESVDFHGAPLAARPRLEGTTLRLELTPWQIATLRIR